MTKQKLISAILESGKIHHNISISWAKMPDYTDEDKSDWQDIAGYMLDDFVDEWQNKPMNDSGNRNLNNCVTEKHPKTSAGACIKDDLWHIYTHGRRGATLYWDKYWKSTNSGFYFKNDWDNELEEMPVNELKTIYKEITAFNKAVTNLMSSFYAECHYKLEESREEKVKEVKEEKNYQQIKNKVLKNNYIKRLVADIL